LRIAHYIAIASAIALTGILYWAVPVTPPPGAAKKAGGGAHQDEGAQAPMAQVAPASLDSIITASKAILPAHAGEELSLVEKKIAGLHDSSAMAPLFEQAAGIWREHKQPAMYAWTTGMAAHLAHSEKKLTFAGQFYLELMHDAATPSMQAWAAQGAVSYLNEALALNPDNDTTKLALATAYIEGTGAPMSGVSILREMVAKNPDHIPANLLLGRLSIQSGQWDKAVARLEHVQKLEPQNREALYFLGEAYKGKGDKEKAIQTFRKLEGIVNSPDFTKDIENYINSFK
jgi:tetratricopeptide (TPR) repeat protein